MYVNQRHMQQDDTGQSYLYPNAHMTLINMQPTHNAMDIKLQRIAVPPTWSGLVSDFSPNVQSGQAIFNISICKVEKHIGDVHFLYCIEETFFLSCLPSSNIETLLHKIVEDFLKYHVVGSNHGPSIVFVLVPVSGSLKVTE